jgi:hypothetical protein
VGIVDDTQSPPRIVERDREVWGSEDIANLSGGRRSFGFWIVGPRPDGFRNRFGTAIYALKWRAGPEGGALRGSLQGFSDEGWGGYQMETRPGRYRVELLLVNRDTGEEQLIKSLTYRIIAGTSGGGRPIHPGGGGRPDLDPQTPSGKGAEVFLSELAESGSGNIHGGLGKDRPYWQPDLIIAGKRYGKGLVTHPGNGAERAYVEYALAGQYQRFLATLGSAADQSNYGHGTMNYAVLVDGRVVEQGRFPTPPATRELSIPVSGAQTLRLEVDNGGDGNHSDHAAWGNARLKR